MKCYTCVPHVGMLEALSGGDYVRSTDHQAAIAQARKDALEEAAKVAKEQEVRTCSTCELSYTQCGEDCYKIADKIRALAQEDPNAVRQD